MNSYYSLHFYSALSKALYSAAFSSGRRVIHFSYIGRLICANVFGPLLKLPHAPLLSPHSLCVCMLQTLSYVQTLSKISAGDVPI